MDPPVCRTCGEKHWSRVCPGGETTHSMRGYEALVPRHVTGHVTEQRHVTDPEIEALRAEVAMLKKRLAEAATRCPACAARREADIIRQKKSRQRRRNA